jgi:hypothetical protein
MNVVAVAFSREERDLLVSALLLAVEHDADPAATRPLISMLEHVPPLEELRTALEAAAS